MPNESCPRSLRTSSVTSLLLLIIKLGGSFHRTGLCAGEPANFFFRISPLSRHPRDSSFYFPTNWRLSAVNTLACRCAYSASILELNLIGPKTLVPFFGTFIEPVRVLSFIQWLLCIVGSCAKTILRLAVFGCWCPVGSTLLKPFRMEQFLLLRKGPLLFSQVLTGRTSPRTNGHGL